MTIKTISVIVIFLTLVFYNPKMLNNMYMSTLGRLILITIIILFSIQNVTLGLLVALIVISASNQYGSFTESSIIEGLDNIGEDNIETTGSLPVLTKSESERRDALKQKISDLKENSDITGGVDKETIKDTIRAKDSNTIDVDPNIMKNEEVSAHQPNMDGFSRYSL